MLISVIYSFLLREVTNKTSVERKETGEKQMRKKGVKMTGVHIL